LAGDAGGYPALRTRLPVDYHRIVSTHNNHPIPTQIRKWIPAAALMALLAAALPACSPAPDTSGLHMMPMEQLASDIQSAPATVRTAYQFAAANRR